MNHDDQREGHSGPSRRKVLECMAWAETGVLWSVAGGVPHSLGLVGEANAQAVSGLTFLQISDSHVGFDKPANPNALGTLEEAINKVKALTVKPFFMIRTGDITHLSKVSKFDDAQRIISQAGLDVHFVPGEHDFLDGGEALSRALRPWEQRCRLVPLRRQRRALHWPRQRDRSEGRRPWQSRQRSAAMAGERPEGPLDIDADRRVRPYPTLDGVSGMGMGHGATLPAPSNRSSVSAP
jgi:hypothetical protein